MKRIRHATIAILLAAAPAQIATAMAEATSHENFAALRHQILNMISGATWRIWIASEYLTDGEIVSALYIAQYRKLDVKVLLGREKASRYLSRLNYLKSQNIPVFLWPRGFSFGYPTAVLADNEIALINGELNYQEKNRRFEVVMGTSNVLNTFVDKFSSAAGQAIPAIPIPRPQVGRAREHTIRSGSPRTGTMLPNGTIKQYSPEELEGSYRYETKRESPDAGMPTKLPESTLWEQKTILPEAPNQP